MNKMKNEQTNKPSQCCLRVSILGILNWGINTIKKKRNGEGPWGGWVGSGSVGFISFITFGRESVDSYWSPG